MATPTDEDDWALIEAMYPGLLEQTLFVVDYSGYAAFHAETMRLLAARGGRTAVPEEFVREAAEAREDPRTGRPVWSVRAIVAVVGEAHRPLVEEACRWLDANEPTWNPSRRIDRLEYVQDLLALRQKLASG